MNAPAGPASGSAEPSISDAVDKLAELKLPVPDATALHLFAPVEPPLPALREIAQTAYSVALALASHQSVAFNESRTISNLRQQSQSNRNLHSSNVDANVTIRTLKARPHMLYGEDIPLDRNVLPWIIARLKAWGEAVGMDVFFDPPAGGEQTVTMAGKVVVCDIVFSASESTSATALKSLKLSYASASAHIGTSPVFRPNATDATECYSLDQFLLDTLGAFVDEVQKGDDIVLPDASQSARLSETFRKHLGDLMKLDTLAAGSAAGELNIGWLNGVNNVAELAWSVTQAEESLIRPQLTVPKPPLDIFLARCHALPLPYLAGANVSFLAHISPLAYMKLTRASDRSPHALLDVSLPTLRRFVHQASPGDGFAWATLSLRPALSDVAYAVPEGETLTLSARPAFDPRIARAQLVHRFPEDAENRNRYMLTVEGGIVMAESRLRDVQQILGIQAAAGAQDLFGGMVGMRYAWSGSWVDLLLNPTKGATSTSYISLYRSPHNLHPLLKLRLTTPNEPGFILGQVPVKSMEQVWAIMEIVREQAWINEILTTCDWIPDMIDSGLPAFPNYGDQSLDALVTGTYAPDSLPIHITIPPALPSLGTEGSAQASLPRLEMAVPMPKRQAEPMMPRTSRIALSLDPSRPKGVCVEVDGVLVDSLDESVRRGGGLGVGGRLWAGLVPG
ncbi:hypothetical protein AURDEDRAFT_149252 [Auricularia subglabra TFB-10046 SS5]|nr:hypothetical protein AURDEDRAFT_149252 [Auricularia subglabra TFB-10046 SS5]